MKKDTRPSDETPVRLTREFRKLQASVHRYLSDSGNWVDDVNDAIDELSRLARDLDNREQQVLQKEAALLQREKQLDCVLEHLAIKSKS